VHHELEQLWRGVGGGGDCGPLLGRNAHQLLRRSVI
jgi:hypothetical protein